MGKCGQIGGPNGSDWESAPPHDRSAVSWPEGMGCESLPALMGDVGTGKTHMASALCALTCERRLEARFFTASSLAMRLRRARDDGKPCRVGCDYRQGSPARHRRARVSPTRRGQGEAALPGLRRRLREAVGGNHHEPGVQQVGVGVRGRPDGRRRDRPHRPPREARPVPWRVPLRPPCPHA